MYIGLDQSLLQSFKGCHDRVRDGKCPSIQWPRNRKGYIAFMKEIGPKPKDMVKPSIGRKNHRKGYVKGNIRWEEHKFNSVKRRGTKFENARGSTVELRIYKFRKGTIEHLEHQKFASRKRWQDPMQHKLMSKRMLGNSYNRFCH